VRRGKPFPRKKKRWILSRNLVRLEIMEPAQIEKRIRKRRRRLRTPKDVIRAISDVVAQIEEGTIEPAQSRAKLYALQTLLVAMRMHAESEPARTLELKAVSATHEFTDAADTTHLTHLQQLTAADPGDPKERQP
jgi:hypothetical protein